MGREAEKYYPPLSNKLKSSERADHRLDDGFVPKMKLHGWQSTKFDVQKAELDFAIFLFGRIWSMRKKETFKVRRESETASS